MAKEEPYQKLRQFLDRFPLGFPCTPSGTEMEILKKLFTREEAELATLLTPFPEEACMISSRTGMNESVLSEKLESMAKKGLVFRARHGGKTYFNSAPFMIGLYEYSVKKMDRELAVLFSRYYEEAYQEEMGASDIPGFKVFPVNEAVSHETVLYPYPALEDEIRAARVISVAGCICRKEAEMNGRGCGRPVETCLHFGAAAEYYIENGIGRRIDAEEALRIVQEADHAGLVHAGVNTRHLSNLCNCCPCCCASMKGITQKGLPRHKYFNPLYEAFIDMESCSACGLCADRCPVEAVSGEPAVIDRDRCLGCGLCSGTCPTGAIRLRLREDREEPFERVIDMGLAMLAAKEKKLGK